VILSLALLVAWLYASTPASALLTKALEQVRGETPEARVNAYMRAVLRDNEEAALEAWTIQDRALPDGRHDALRERRERVTRQLIASQWDDSFRINHIEWWRTCCEPGVICNGLDAGGARIQVQLLDLDGLPHVFVFDVFHRDGPYWGAAMGYQPRRWTLYDVYPDGEEALFWRYVYEPKVRWLAWPSPNETPAP